MCDEIWTRVERKLNRPVTKGLRGFIEKETQYIEMVRNKAPNAFLDLVDYVRSVEHFFEGPSGVGGYSRSAPSTRSGRKRRATRAEGYEKERLQLRTSYLIKRIEADDSAIRLRRELFRGKKLTRPQARRWLASPAPRFLSQEAFRSLGIPITAHDSRIVGIRRSAREEGNLFIAEEHVNLEITWRGGRVSPEFGYRWRHTRGSHPPSRPQFPVLSEDGTVMRLAGFPHTVFDALQHVSQQVAKDTRWPEFDAALFVLTGIPPDETGIRFNLRPDWTSCLAEDVIVLTVDSWISAETVAQTYRDLQRDVLDGRSRAHEKSLAIVKLAIELMEPGGAPPTPDDLFDAWNKRFPEEPYEDRWRFRSHYKEAFRQLLRPGEVRLEKFQSKRRGKG